MSQEFNAIYEGGVFRPLTPLSLPESTPVTVVVRGPNDGTPDEAVDLKHQQQALDAMFSIVDKLPQTPCDDGLSGRDHDQILYGTPKGS